MISETLLEKYGGVKFTVNKGDWIFREGDHARFFFQIVQGEVKMSNYSSNGKEFVQGIFGENQSFGEPPLFEDIAYPASAIAHSDGELYKLTKDHLLTLLLENPKENLSMTKVLAKRLHYKAIMASEISSQEPEHRIITLLNYLKNELHLPENKSFEVKLTRQQIGDMTGLRVETVIRSIKKLEKEGKISIMNRKVFL